MSSFLLVVKKLTTIPEYPSSPRLDSTIEKQMLLWESANANSNDTLFINKIAGILEKYGMHTPMELLINPPSKHMGKIMIKKAINEYWYTEYNEENSTKTTIRHLEIQKEPIGTPHNIWNCGIRFLR